MKIKFNDEEVKVIILRKKIKNIYFRFNENNELVVSVHPNVKEDYIIKLLKDNYVSLNKMYNKLQKKKEYDNRFYFLGKEYTIIYDEKIKKPVMEEDFITFRDEKMKEKFLNKACEKIFKDRIEDIKPRISYVPEFRLRIRKMKTRWGVCNRKDNIITLNSELIKKDITLIDYVIIHEMCHFKEGNHSKLFWNEVNKYYPNYKLARKRLRSE